MDLNNLVGNFCASRTQGNEIHCGSSKKGWTFLLAVQLNLCTLKIEHVQVFITIHLKAKVFLGIQVKMRCFGAAIVDQKYKMNLPFLRGNP